MKELELYDIITIDNDKEYTILKNTNFNDRKYYLIAPVNKEEEIDAENIKIVEEIKKEGKIMIQEVINEETLKALSKIFLNSIKEDIKY